jgi:hypothetical protein
MTRLTSAFAHVLPMVAAGFLFIAPVLAQSTPPALPEVPPGLLEPAPQRPSTAAPTAVPPGQGRQPGPGQQGQQGQPAQAMTPPATPPRPASAPNIGGPNNQGLPPQTNIKLDLTITDTFTGSPVKKTVTMLVLQNNGGMIRTSSADGWAILNVDAIAAAYTSGLISIRLTFEYTPAMTREVVTSNNSTGGRPPRLNESITVVLQDGKPMVVSQSADPANERKVTTELTATILK